MNLLTLIVFLPALWLFGTLGSTWIAAVLGLVFVGARVVYGITYVANPESRVIPFVVGYVSTAVMVIGALVSAVLGG